MVILAKGDTEKKKNQDCICGIFTVGREERGKENPACTLV